MSGKCWTHDEEAVLRTVYPVQGAEAVRAALPSRTHAAILNRAHLLKLSPPRGPKTPRPWSVDDDRRLRRIWKRRHEFSTLKAIARRLKRSPELILRQARRLGLAGERSTDPKEAMRRLLLTGLVKPRRREATP